MKNKNNTIWAEVRIIETKDSFIFELNDDIKNLEKIKNIKKIRLLKIKIDNEIISLENSKDHI